jgi:hypothetical protein
MPHRVPSAILLLLLGLAGTTVPASAQSRTPAVVQRPGEVLGPRADEMRNQFRQLMGLYPPALGRVLKLDPTLMTNAQYLAPYPALAEFLKEHPEVARYPSYFLEYVQDYEYRGVPSSPEMEHNRRVVQMWENVMVGIFVFALIVTVSVALVTLVKHFVGHRRWLRATRIQSEFHNRLVERMGSSGEVLAYAQSSGRDLLPSLPPVEAAVPSLTAPFGRILWSVQVGVVAACVGIGMLFVKRYLLEEVAQMLLTLGVLILSLGIGFALAAAASYMLSARLGLLTPPRPTDGRGPIGG